MNLKRVFLFTIDALRADHLKCYGYHRNTVPNIERESKRGTIFINAFSNGPESPSSFSAIFTSVLPLLNGGFSPLPNQKKMFTEILKQHGIYTYGVHFNPNLTNYFGYKRGFDVFLDGINLKNNKSIVIKRKSQKKPLKSHLRNFFIFINKRMGKYYFYKLIKDLILNKFTKLQEFEVVEESKKGGNAAYITKKILTFLKRSNKDKSLFVWGHFMDTHNPYNPPIRNLLKFTNKDISLTKRKFLNYRIYYNPNKYKITIDNIEKLKLLYDGEINFVDKQLSKILKFINKKYKKNSLVIITSDHGDAFYEHSFFGHQGHIFDELLRVPLIFLQTGKKSLVSTILEPVQLIDLAPTILDFYGIRIPEYFQGKSLLNILEGEESRENEWKNRIIISESYQKGGKAIRKAEDGFKIISIRDFNWKYIYNEELEEEKLYNIINDPGEKKNLINRNSEITEKFRELKKMHLFDIINSNEELKIDYAIKRIIKKDLKN